MHSTSCPSRFPRPQFFKLCLRALLFVQVICGEERILLNTGSAWQNSFKYFILFWTYNSLSKTHFRMGQSGLSRTVWSKLQNRLLIKLKIFYIPSHLQATVDFIVYSQIRPVLQMNDMPEENCKCSLLSTRAAVGCVQPVTEISLRTSEATAFFEGHPWCVHLSKAAWNAWIMNKDE